MNNDLDDVIRKILSQFQYPFKDPVQSLLEIVNDMLKVIADIIDAMLNPGRPRY